MAVSESWNCVYLLVLVGALGCQALQWCDKRTACSCESDEGLIDLAPLDGTHKSLQASGYDYYYYHEGYSIGLGATNASVDYVIGNDATKMADDVTETMSAGHHYCHFRYSPCTFFTWRGCSNSAICQEYDDSNGDRSFVVGSHPTVSFSMEDGQVVIVMDDGTAEATRSANITLYCDGEVENDFQFIEENPLDHYVFTLTSRHACPKESGAVPSYAPPARPTTYHPAPVTTEAPERPTTTTKKPTTPTTTHAPTTTAAPNTTTAAPTTTTAAPTTTTTAPTTTEKPTTPTTEPPTPAPTPAPCDCTAWIVMVIFLCMINALLLIVLIAIVFSKQVFAYIRSSEEPDKEKILKM